MVGDALVDCSGRKEFELSSWNCEMFALDEFIEKDYVTTLGKVFFKTTNAVQILQTGNWTWIDCRFFGFKEGEREKKKWSYRILF